MAVANGGNSGTNNGGGNGNNGGGGSGGNGNNIEGLVFFYHPDHLGSSSYITDANGEVSQHLEYFAFGETFVEEHSNKDATPYLYNAKELDEETGLYYYGARYYDPVTSVWQSVDPLVLYDPVKEVEAYLDGQHNGGVFNSGNLASYSYTYQNPILYVDPNGKQSEFYEYFNSHSAGVNALKQNKECVIEYSKAHKVSAQAVASIIYQEKSAGLRGKLANVYAKFYKAKTKGDATASLGIGEIQVRLAAELMGIECDLGKEDIDFIIQELESNERSIDLIAKNVSSFEDALCRDVTVDEATYGHNVGKQKLIENPDKAVEGNRVSNRSRKCEIQKEISNVLSDDGESN